MRLRSKTVITRRRVVALLGALVPLVFATTPAHASLQSEYAMPWSVCDWTQPVCTARTTVHVLLPSDYAFCVANLTASQQLAGHKGTDVPGVVDVDQLDMCGYPGGQEAMLEALLQWTPGSCAGNGHLDAFVHATAPVWAASGFTNRSASPTCSTIDSAYTQTIAFAGCPGTSFQLTADVKGNADGTYVSSWDVTATGPCADDFDTVAVEGAPSIAASVLPGCCGGATSNHAAAASPAQAQSPPVVRSRLLGAATTDPRRLDSVWREARCLPSAICAN